MTGIGLYSLELLNINDVCAGTGASQSLIQFFVKCYKMPSH